MIDVDCPDCGSPTHHTRDEEDGCAVHECDVCGKRIHVESGVVTNFVIEPIPPPKHDSKWANLAVAAREAGAQGNCVVLPKGFAKSMASVRTLLFRERVQGHIDKYETIHVSERDGVIRVWITSR